MLLFGSPVPLTVMPPSPLPLSVMVTVGGFGAVVSGFGSGGGGSGGLGGLGWLPLFSDVDVVPPSLSDATRPITAAAPAAKTSNAPASGA